MSDPIDDMSRLLDSQQAGDLTDGGIGSTEGAPQDVMPETDRGREAAEERPDA
ncbi:hypothetical protein DEJ34_02475 [Curtobacterium sp. MCPF17_050]|uniref:hypothetical protein n=1 Tax=Curtobacterium sp. MCPF17_050 TaxID=2175664 RepID=UPI0015E891F5|nr:hypothetical protein [Curtobacterium sp. MCPF17_050]WIB16015.1 hypothetical protein DEJ34_02475 [Curtobacterium sp. MCPF17_050]